jgi:hypothetical protein
MMSQTKLIHSSMRLPPDLRETEQSVERPFSDHQLLDVGHALVEVAATEDILPRDRSGA